MSAFLAQNGDGRDDETPRDAAAEQEAVVVAAALAHHQDLGGSVHNNNNNGGVGYHVNGGVGENGHAAVCNGGDLMPPLHNKVVGSHKSRKSAKHEDEEAGKIFVGGLSWETSQDSLLEYFSSYGDVVDCVVMKNAESGRSRGFGFVTFGNPANIEKVMSHCPHSLDGRTIDPKPCNPRSQQKPKVKSGLDGTIWPKVFLGGLPSSATETDLRAFFERYGEVVEVVIMYDQEKKKARGFGFLSFVCEEAADRAVSEHYVNIQNKQVEIKRAEPRANLPSTTTTDYISTNGSISSPNKSVSSSSTSVEQWHTNSTLLQGSSNSSPPPSLSQHPQSDYGKLEMWKRNHGGPSGRSQNLKGGTNARTHASANQMNGVTTSRGHAGQAANAIHNSMNRSRPMAGVWTTHQMPTGGGWVGGAQQLAIVSQPQQQPPLTPQQPAYGQLANQHQQTRPTGIGMAHPPQQSAPVPTNPGPQLASHPPAPPPPNHMTGNPAQPTGHFPANPAHHPGNPATMSAHRPANPTQLPPAHHIQFACNPPHHLVQANGSPAAILTPSAAGGQQLAAAYWTSPATGTPAGGGIITNGLANASSIAVPGAGVEAAAANILSPPLQAPPPPHALAGGGGVAATLPPPLQVPQTPVGGAKYEVIGGHAQHHHTHHHHHLPLSANNSNPGLFHPHVNNGVNNIHSINSNNDSLNGQQQQVGAVHAAHHNQPQHHHQQQRQLSVVVTAPNSHQPQHHMQQPSHQVTYSGAEYVALQPTLANGARPPVNGGAGGVAVTAYGEQAVRSNQHNGHIHHHHHLASGSAAILATPGGPLASFPSGAALALPVAAHNIIPQFRVNR